MGCVNSANFVILINREPTNFFKITCGLRQGCPLSPLLFLFIVESLSRLIHKDQSEGNLKGIKLSQLILITHLLFVNDVILFYEGIMRSGLHTS